MAIRAACASTNFLTATTWATVDATSYSASEATANGSSTSYQTSSTFTPGAITVDGFGLKLASKSGSSGTFTVALDLATADVAGTVVTINASDLPTTTQAGLDGGWIFFKFAAPVTLAGATAYGVKIKHSVGGSTVNLFVTATTNWSRYLRTTTTGAPAAGDDLIIAGEWTAAATVTTRTVTMDETAATDYGSAPTAANGLLSPGIAIGEYGVLTFKDTSAANPYLRLSNSLIVYNGGTLNIGTVATPIPRDSTAILEFDLAADGDYGLVARNGSIVTKQGLSRTVGKNIVSAKLTADAAASGGAPSTSTLTIDTDTGWLSGDVVAVASTSRTAADCEVGTLNANAGASSIVVKDMTAGSAGMAYPPTSNRGLLVAHSGTSPTQAEVILLSRNVKIRSTSAALMSYVNITDGAVVDIDWAEFYYLGISSTAKRGIELTGSTNNLNFSMQFCSLHDFEAGGFYNTNTSPTITSCVFSSNTMWNLATVTGPGCQFTTATAPTNWTYDSNIMIRTGQGNGWTLSDVGGTFTNNTVAGAASGGISIAEAAALGTFTGIVTHSNAGNGVSTGAAGISGTLGLASWRNSLLGLTLQNSVVDFTLAAPVMFGNVTTNIQISAACTNLRITSPVLSGDTTFSTTNGINFANVSMYDLVITDGDFSTVSGIKTAHTNDINVAANLGLKAVLLNTKLGASVEVATPSNLSNNGFIASEKHDATAGNHMTWMRNGKVQTDTTIFNTASPSMRMTPTSATLKLESAYQFQGMKVAVASGATVTIAAYVRKSVVGDGAAYNGNQPLLVLKSNPAIGIAADTTMATAAAAAGTWEQLTGTTAAATDDGVMEFVFQVDGTAGWANVDDWSAV